MTQKCIGCLLGVGFFLFSMGNVLADSSLSTLSVGAQSPPDACRGSSAARLVTVTRTGNGNMDTYLQAAGLAFGAMASFSPNPIRFSGSASSATATLTLTSSSQTPPGANSFTVIATDGASHNSRTNTVSFDLTLCSPGLAPMTDGCMCMAFAGAPGQTSAVQATTNLFAPNWITLCTTNLGTNSLFVFTDADAPKYPSRFYRAVPAQ